MDITRHIELTLLHDNTRQLVPLESIQGVCEVKRPKEEIIEGQLKKIDEISCMVIVLATSFRVKETYDQVKAKIKCYEQQR